MALRLELKPHERLILGDAVVRNGPARAVLVVENRVPVLRASDILGPRAVRTPCERIYLALQLAYLDRPRAARHRATYRGLATEVVAAAPSCGRAIRRIDASLEAGRAYEALKHARALIRHERELIARVS